MRIVRAARPGTGSRRPPKRSRHYRRLILAMTLWLPLLQADAAPYCSTSSSPSINFGAVPASGYQDAQTAVVLNCNGGVSTLLTPAIFRVCLFIGTGTSGAMAPRLMSNGNGDFMRYDLYADAYRSQLIGPQSSGYPLYSLTFRLAPRENLSFRIPIHARVHAGQNLPGRFPYSDMPYNSFIRYSYGYIHTPTESDCRERYPGSLGGAGDISFNWSGVQATVTRSCRISTLSQMNFGATTAFEGNREQTASLQLKCTRDVAWQVSLDEGMHAQSGGRFMASADARLGYELYSDASRSSRWGNTQSSAVSGVGNGEMQGLTVYGQVPAQPGALPGNYQDTITVTLTY